MLPEPPLTWRGDDPLYNRVPRWSFGADWRRARQSFLPAAIVFVAGGLLMVVGRWWRSAPTAIWGGLVIANVVAVGLMCSVFFTNRPARLVRPASR